MALRVVPFLGELNRAQEIGFVYGLSEEIRRAGFHGLDAFLNARRHAVLWHLAAGNSKQLIAAMIQKFSSKHHFDTYWAARLLMLHHNLGSDRHAAVEVGNILVDHTEAPRRYSLANRLRRIGAVDAIDGRADI
jgi:hypothetical protein